MYFEKFCSVWRIDHCLPKLSYILLDENDMKKCFNWINLGLMYSTENNSKKAKIDPYLYLLQEVKAKYFIKRNEEGPNKDNH